MIKINIWLHLKSLSPPNLQTVQKYLFEVVFALFKAISAFFEMPQREIKINVIFGSPEIFSAAYRQGKDIAIGLCPDTGNPPCVGQKADLAEVGTVAE